MKTKPRLLKPKSQTSSLEGLAPIVGLYPKVLFLGSMPGAASLAAQAYYAHPRNAFWPIMAELFGFNLASYADNVRQLTAAGGALWDVIATCQRRGSLDSAIKLQSEQYQPLLPFIKAQPSLKVVALNGGKAAASLHRYLKQANEPLGLPSLALPSTSPAHARMSVQEKKQAWFQSLSPYLK